MCVLCDLNDFTGHCECSVPHWSSAEEEVTHRSVITGEAFRNHTPDAAHKNTAANKTFSASDC